MKKRNFIAGIVLIALALVLFLPIPLGAYDDGGTEVYAALTYKIVKWNRTVLTCDETEGEIIDTYSKTSFYWIPDSIKSLDELWEEEYPTN